jgi:hypothetical protein
MYNERLGEKKIPSFYVKSCIPVSGLKIYELAMLTPVTSSGGRGTCIGAKGEYLEKERQFRDSGKYIVFVKI